MVRFSGPKLRQARLRSGAPITRVALDVGRSVESLRCYESGRIDPPASIVAALAESLGVDPGELFADDQEVAA